MIAGHSRILHMLGNLPEKALDPKKYSRKFFRQLPALDFPMKALQYQAYKPSTNP